MNRLDHGFQLCLTEELDFVKEQDQTGPIVLGSLTDGNQNISEIQSEVSVISKTLGGIRI